MMVKLNALQSRTLALLQELALDETNAARDEASGNVRIHIHLHAHHDHIHIGRFTVSTRFASGLQNANVWKVLERKGLAIGEFPMAITLTPAGLAFKTGVRERMLKQSDH